jgi:predicted nucleic acid-binding protein
MTGNKKEIHYWDSCIFLSIITDEKRNESEKQGLLHYIDRYEKGEIILLVSSIIFTEIMPQKTGNEKMEIFKKFSRRIQIIAADQKVCELAGKLRDKISLPGSNRSLSTPDAIHLATAHIHKVNEFVTFDSGKNDKKTMGLLGLNSIDYDNHSFLINKPQHKGQLPLIMPEEKELIET